MGNRCRMQVRGLAVDALHVGFGVAVASYGVGGDGSFEFRDLFGGEMDVAGGGVFFEVLAALGAGNGNEVNAFAEDPGEGELAGLDTFAIGDGADAIDEDLVLIEVVAGEAWVARFAKVLSVELRVFGDGAGEEAAAEGRVGDEADAELAADRDDFGFGVALPKGVFGLESGDGVNFVGASDGGGGGFRKAEVFNLASFDELGHGADGVFDRGVGIDAVLVVEIDVIEAEALERSIAGLADVLGLARDAPEGGVFSFAEIGELGGEKDFVAAGLDGVADQLFVVAHAVDVGGVEEGDAEVERAKEGGGGLFVVAFAVELAHAHAAETLAGDDGALCA